MLKACFACKRRLSRFGVSLLSLFILLTSVPGLAQRAVPTGTKAPEFAFFGSNFADWAVVTLPTSSGNPIVWKIMKNPADPTPGQAQIRIFNWGTFGDVITPGSWTGDGTYDPGIWRNLPGFGYWTLRWETPTQSDVLQFGGSGDNLGREGDYNGDGRTDPTALKIISGQLQWWIRLSGTSPVQTRTINFGSTAAGQSTFAFRGADFTGDGVDELIVARASASGAVTWFIGSAVNGEPIKQVQWGNFNTHFLVNPADYTGDGRADFVTWAAGEPAVANRVWWILDSNTGAVVPPIPWGIGDDQFINNDLPVRGDYDGDGIHDVCVWRPSTITFHCRASSNGSWISQQWGSTGDIPLGNFFTF